MSFQLINAQHINVLSSRRAKPEVPSDTPPHTPTKSIHFPLHFTFTLTFQIIKKQYILALIIII